MIVHFIFSFIISLIFTIILTFFLKRKAPGPYGGIFYFFSIIFLFTVALGIWLTPIGPMFRHIPWVSLIGIALLVTLLIAELVPHKDKYQLIRKKNPEDLTENEEEVLEKEFGITLWVILTILTIAIVYAIFAHHGAFKMTF